MCGGGRTQVSAVSTAKVSRFLSYRYRILSSLAHLFNPDGCEQYSNCSTRNQNHTSSPLDDDIGDDNIADDASDEHADGDSYTSADDATYGDDHRDTASAWGGCDPQYDRNALCPGS